MKKNYVYETEAFELLMKLEEGRIRPEDVVAWADRKLEGNEYNDDLANISVYRPSSNRSIHDLLKELIGDYSTLEIEYAKSEAVIVAKRIINEDIHLVLGCRVLDRITTQLGLDETPEYRIFCGVDSEADGFPITEKQRSHWSTEALEKKDKEYERAVASYLFEVKSACRSLINQIDRDRTRPH